MGLKAQKQVYGSNRLVVVTSFTAGRLDTINMSTPARAFRAAIVCIIFFITFVMYYFVGIAQFGTASDSSRRSLLIRERYR